jgi:drug/metabolite transporter (DMT)-like permease
MINQKKAYIFALMAVLCWSTVATAFKIALQNCSFIQLLFYSSLVSTIMLFIILIIQKKTSQLIKMERKTMLYSLTLGILNPFLYYSILFKAYSILPAQEAMTLNYTWPIMLVLLSIPLLKQKLTIKSLIAVFISFAGIIIISTKGNIVSLSLSNVLGDLLAVGSSIVWALFWIYNVKDKKDEVLKLFLNFFMGTICSGFLMIALTGFTSLNVAAIPAIIYVGILEMSVTFVFWILALKYTASTDKVSQLIFLSPFLSLLFIHLIIKESIAIYTLTGLFFIIGGIVVQQSSFNFLKKRKQTSI